MNFKFQLILAFIFITTNSFANKNNPAQIECANAKNESEMYDCVHANRIKSEGTLISLYRSLYSRYKTEPVPSGRTQKRHEVYLKKAQDVWMQYRKSSCDFETYESINGTGFGSIYERCLLKHTQKRIQYLKWYVDNP